jgi:hypothetical protein
MPREMTGRGSLWRRLLHRTGVIGALGGGQFVSGEAFFEGAQWFIAGWSSPVARQAHNLKVTGSNPVPATK